MTSCGDRRRLCRLRTPPAGPRRCLTPTGSENVGPTFCSNLSVKRCAHLCGATLPTPGRTSFDQVFNHRNAQRRSPPHTRSASCNRQVVGSSPIAGSKNSLPVAFRGSDGIITCAFGPDPMELPAQPQAACSSPAVSRAARAWPPSMGTASSSSRAGLRAARHRGSPHDPPQRPRHQQARAARSAHSSPRRSPGDSTRARHRLLTRADFGRIGTGRIGLGNYVALTPSRSKVSRFRQD